MGANARDADANSALFAWGIYGQYRDARIALDLGGSASWWFLRSPGGGPRHAAHVLATGRLDLGGTHMHAPDGGIRPAMWLYL